MWFLAPQGHTFRKCFAIRGTLVHMHCMGPYESHVESSNCKRTGCAREVTIGDGSCLCEKRSTEIFPVFLFSCDSHWVGSEPTLIRTHAQVQPFAPLPPPFQALSLRLPSGLRCLPRLCTLLLLPASASVLVGFAPPLSGRGPPYSVLGATPLSFVSAPSRVCRCCFFIYAAANTRGCSERSLNTFGASVF